MGKRILLFLACLPVVTPAASFSLGAVLRAGGLLNNELQLGSTTSSPSSAGNLFPFWVNGVDHEFQLAYDATTNIATLAGDWLGGYFASSIEWNVAGGSVSSAPRTWTIGSGGIQLTAKNNTLVNTSVFLHDLQLSGPGLAVINPPSLTAAQTGSGTVTAASTAPITFVTPDGGGSWVLNGHIRFSGLGLFGATGDDLRVAFDVTASDAAAVATPEPESLLLSALGFAALGVLHRFRARRRARVVIGRGVQTGTSSKC